MATDPKLNRFGETPVPVMSVDAIGVAPECVIELAQPFAPFPPATNHYPGVRHIVAERDGAAFDYIVNLLEEATPYLAGAFDFDRFELTEASFSMVTVPPERLTFVQRAPHFDDVDPNIIAVLHYLADCAGTAFFRHCETGMEMISPATLGAYVEAARRTPAGVGYVGLDDPYFSCTGKVAGVAGRLVAYPASALHSGIIPTGFEPSTDPFRGRLTTNIFIRVRR